MKKKIKCAKCKYKIKIYKLDLVKLCGNCGCLNIIKGKRKKVIEALNELGIIHHVKLKKQRIEYERT